MNGSNICTSNVVTGYTVIACANITKLDSSLLFLYLSNNCEHFALSVLYRVSSIVCLKKVLRDQNVPYSNDDIMCAQNLHVLPIPLA